MATQFLRFTLYAIVIYLVGTTLNPAVAASHPAEGNGAHVCGVIDYSPDNHRPTFLNRNYAQAPAANLNVGDPYTVRLIYFLPSDRQPRPYIGAQMNTLIKKVQQGYANDMDRYGFGRKTFTFETDVTGKAVVHHLNGQFTADYYEHKTFDKVGHEVNEQFDTLQNIYLVVVDSGYAISGIAGQATLGDEGGGMALIHGIGIEGIINKVYITSHELGHTFGLRHDFRNDAYIMSYGGSYQSYLSQCAAERLDIHPYFNPTRPNQNFNKNTTIGAFTARSTSLPNTIGLRFEVTDPDGLHQAQLYTPEVKSNHRRLGGLLACKQLTGTSSTVEIVTNALGPRNRFVSLQVIDVHGNISWSQQYPINITTLLAVSIPDARLAMAVRKHLGGAALTRYAVSNLRNLRATHHRITSLTGLEHAINLVLLSLGGNSVSDISALAGLTNLTTLSLGNNSISDISALAGLTNLKHLSLGNNSVSGISALAGLTNLTNLSLGGNSVSDIPALAGLTNLTTLSLGNNSVSDISALTGLTNLTNLSLGSNSISDISALAGLTNLTTVSWEQFNIRYISVGRFN